MYYYRAKSKRTPKIKYFHTNQGWVMGNNQGRVKRQDQKAGQESGVRNEARSKTKAWSGARKQD